MDQDVHSLQNLFSENKLFDFFKQYNFEYVSGRLNWNQLNPKVYQNLQGSKIITINQYTNKNQTTECKYHILSFEKTIIIFNHLSKEFLYELLNINPKLSFLFLYDPKDIIIESERKKFNEIHPHEKFKEEIKNFTEKLNIPIQNKSIYSLYENIKLCIASYLIQKSYQKLNKNRVDIVNSNHEQSESFSEIYEEDYIELRLIKTGGSFHVFLIYHIEREELFAIKKINNFNEESKLIQRVCQNNPKLNHQFLPKFYGTVKNRNYLVMEFIDGKTLNSIDIKEYNDFDIFKIIYELILSIKYLHDNHFIYRDLKPDNIIIDQNKDAIIIDFDRMIKYEDIGINKNYTRIFPKYTAPEVNTGNYSYECDNYSLGFIMKYIISKRPQSEGKKYFKIKQIYEECLNIEPKYRPSTSKLIDFFLQIIINSICSQYHNSKNHEGKYIALDINKVILYYSLAANQNVPRAQFYLGAIYDEGKYVKRDINKAIHYYLLAANQNDPQAQCNLGVIYSEGKYIKRNINKAIHYYSLAANQNIPQAQFNLGVIFFNGKYITRDINKAIHYYSLAANQNVTQAQFNLGLIYYEGKYIKRNINKAIQYYSLAAKENYPQAQFYLGLIYDDGKYIKRDINKAIHYYSLAANQNGPQAQFNLGLIYYEGKYIKRDINKAIYYYSLAANQNYPQAQFYLGLIYYEGKYVIRDINKAILYYSLAANQNDSRAQFYLAVIYDEGKYVIRDINKAILYYSLASNQNISQAQFNLGLIYYEGKYIKRNINKAIYFYSLAANQNYPQAQFNLGLIYHEGKYIKQNINKAILYYSLASNQNISQAQCNLGLIYYEGKHITQDVNKAIHYYSLAAKQNYSQAQFYLGFIYYEGKYIKRDINKAIHYFLLAANQNVLQAQFNLGFIYYEGKYIMKNINKAIHYYQLAANQNDSNAQLIIGNLYLNGIYVKKDIQKGLNYLAKSSDNGNKIVTFILGYLYHEQKYIRYDIQKCINYYKDSSSFNIEFSKNNLGIIYKRGFDDKIEPNVCIAENYFIEAIRLKKSVLSMYNLANIYIYDEQYNYKKDNVNKSIILLIESITLKFKPSYKLLCISLIKKHRNDYEKMKKEIYDLVGDESGIFLKVRRIINIFQLENHDFFNKFVEHNKNLDFLYDNNFQPISFEEFSKRKYSSNQKVINNIPKINDHFYEGFGC